MGFLVGEKVEGSTVIFDGVIRGSAIAAAEFYRATNFWVPPDDSNVANPGQLNENYIPGDLKFDPAGIRPSDPDKLFTMQTKELQNGRLAMLATAGFMAQELTDGKGIFEHLGY